MRQLQATTKQNLVRTTEIDVKTFKQIRTITEKKISHFCSTHGEHATWGKGTMITEMHTLDESGHITHYDIQFDHGIERNVPVTELFNMIGETHEHKMNKKKNKQVREQHDLQGSSVKKVPYVELDMNNLAKSAADLVGEDDGPHTSKLTGTEVAGYETVADPTNAVNQPNSLGNVDGEDKRAARIVGKPFKMLRKKQSGYGPEDLSGAVAGVAMGEAVKTEADKGEYDYEGDMAKSQLRSIMHNAKLMHDMLEDDTNLAEWVQNKITLAEDYIVTAAQYMQSQMSEEVAQFEEQNISELKRSTLAAYVKDASMDMANTAAQIVRKKMSGYSETLPQFTANVSADVKKFQKRQKGISLASKKLGKD
jgi:hypothetical protein